MKCLCNFLGQDVFSEPLQCVFALILHVSLVWWEMMGIRGFFSCPFETTADKTV